MSPLWSDLALARAALADAVERGVIDKRTLQSENNDAAKVRAPVRRVPRRTGTASFAL
jgi:hypothetical protein